MLRKLLKNRKGVTGMVIALVVSLVAIGIIIPIGLLVTSTLQTSITEGMNTTSAAYNVTEDVFANIWTAFSLSALVPIIAVAGLLIAIIVGAFAFRASRR